MTRIDWESFSKEELVEILHFMEERVWLVEKLSSNSESFAEKDCSCDIVDRPLPESLLHIQAEATRRKSRVKRIANPLTSLLRRRVAQKASRRDQDSRIA